MDKEEIKPISLYEAYETDANAEETGQWVDMKGGIRVKVRSEESLTVRRWTAKQAKKRRTMAMASGGTLPPELADKIDIQCCAEVLVVDWEGVTDRSGVLLTCTKANIIQVMTELPRLRQDVIFSARVAETFQPEAVEAVEKNSSASLSTS